MNRTVRALFALLLMLLLLVGCAAHSEEVSESVTEPETVTQSAAETATQADDNDLAAQAQAAADAAAVTAEQVTEDDTEAVTEDGTEPVTEPEPEKPTQRFIRSLVVCIDAGHQEHGNSDKEPIGPGSSTMKAKVAGGATGTETGQHEYALNLQVALKLEQILEERGYRVVMVRYDNDVDISNAERSEIANAANADAFVRIHANGAANSTAHGAMTICMTSDNPYNGHLYRRSRALSEAVLDGVVAATGCRREYVWETDTMTGINWCEVPVTIVEMGYLSNPEEDRLLATEEYQNLVATGIANGLDDYFESNPPDDVARELSKEKE